MKKVIPILLVVVFFSITTRAASDTTALSLQVGAASKYSAISVIDLVTGNAVSATISSITVQNSNPEFANVTSSLSPVGVFAYAVAPGTGTATITCHVNYTDAGDGQLKSEDKAVVIAYTVIGSPHGVKLSLSF